MTHTISRKKEAKSQAVRRVRRALNVLLALALVLTALGSPSLVARAANDDHLSADPNLLQLAADHPGDVFPVIVQKDASKKDLPDDEPEVSVEKAGGKVKRDKKMDFIVSFAAELTGKEILKLAKHPKVRWISLDAPLFSSALPGFGATGNVTTAIGSGADSIRNLAVQSDGKIVVVGVASNGADNDFAVARYNTNGSLDITFDGDGKLTLGFGLGNDEANGVAVQPDGKIVVAGTSYNGIASLFTVVRFNSNGSLDTTFDGDGKVTTAVTNKNNDIARSVIVQSDGKILVVGHSYNGANDDFALARYNSNGSLDTTFGASGKVTTAIGFSHDDGYSVAVQSDGKFLVAGQTYNGIKYNFALARYNSNGSLDTAFGSSGKVTTSISTGTDRAYSVAVQTDGKILAAGESNFDFALARYNSNGSLDTTFGFSGKVTTPIGFGYNSGRSLALQADGKILVAGYVSSFGNNDFALARYNSNGALDTTFDGNGKLTTVIGTGNDYAYSVKVQSDGRIVVAGSAANGGNDDFAVVRYNSDGGLDCTQCMDTGNLANIYDRSVGADHLWNAPGYLQGQGVTVAVVDSGFGANADFEVYGGGTSRLITSATLITNAVATNDGYGHGTFVAGIIGGSGNGGNGARIGIAPGANLVNVKVANEVGMATASDLISGLQWIYTNRAAYNIKVVNISMNSSVVESYQTSPLDAAAEVLWFNGIVVVVSAGNNGTATLYPPANDPFVITVGAVDDMGTVAISDDAVTSFSAYGTTSDGFAKPDLVAPGRNIISLLASTSAGVYTAHPPNRVDNYVFRMSGTSFAAPMVSGAVALLLQDEPGLTPDQVKFRLKATANTSWSGYNATTAGAGYLDAYAAVNGATTQSANSGTAASQLLTTGSDPVNSSVNWNSVNWNSVNWNSVNWNSVNWNSVNWNSVNWNSDCWEP